MPPPECPKPARAGSPSRVLPQAALLEVPKALTGSANGPANQEGRTAVGNAQFMTRF